MSKLTPISDSILRERLFKLAIGKTINGKDDNTPWDLMPPTKHKNHKKQVSYVSKFFPKCGSKRTKKPTCYEVEPWLSFLCRHAQEKSSVLSRYESAIKTEGYALNPKNIHLENIQTR